MNKTTPQAILRSIVAAAWLNCLAAAILPTPVAAAVDSFRLRQIASSQEGNSQVIELAEVDGKDGQDGFAGLTLTVTNRHGVSKTLLFESNLPNTGTANRHVTLGRTLSGAFQGGAFRPDFELPPGFLPTDGGTIDFAGIDSWTFDAVPTDGALLRRGGEVRPGTVQNFAGKVTNCCGPIWADPMQPLGIELTTIFAAEFYNLSLDHYFISASQPDIDALVSGRIPGWRMLEGPEGSYIPAASLPTTYGGPRPGATPVKTSPVCRYFIPPGSHFFSASSDECSAVAHQHPEFVFETSAAFHVVLPDLATGECPSDLGGAGVFVTFIPVYRLWNKRTDTNHRYTTSTRIRAEMIDKGWISEGYGPLGVAMCAPDWE